MMNTMMMMMFLLDDSEDECEECTCDEIETLAIEFTPEDVMEVREDLDIEQARQVLEQVHNDHDYDTNTIWEEIINVAEDLFPEEVKDVMAEES